MAFIVRASRTIRSETPWRHLRFAATFSDLAGNRISKSLEEEIEYLREQDKLWLYRTSRECATILNWLEKNIPSKPESIDSLIKSAGRQDFIGTQRWDNVFESAKARDALIDQLKVIQGHCSDLSTEPYPEWSEEVFRQSEQDARQGQTDEEYRLTLEIEEQTLRSRLEMDLERFQRFVEREEDLVAAKMARGPEGTIALSHTLGKSGGAGFAEGGRPVTRDRITEATGLASDDAELDTANSLVDAGWDDLQAQVEQQIENEGR